MLSAWHKSQGDEVKVYDPLFDQLGGHSGGTRYNLTTELPAADHRIETDFFLTVLLSQLLPKISRKTEQFCEKVRDS